MLEKVPSEKVFFTAKDIIKATTAIQKAKAAKSLEKLKKKGKCSETANLSDTIEVRQERKLVVGKDGV